MVKFLHAQMWKLRLVSQSCSSTVALKRNTNYTNPVLWHVPPSVQTLTQNEVLSPQRYIAGMLLIDMLKDRASWIRCRVHCFAESNLSCECIFCSTEHSQNSTVECLVFVCLS